MHRRSAASSRDAARLFIRRAVAESLETRRLLAQIIVDTSLDENVANATTSLREAVITADANSEDDEILFDAFVFDAGSSHTITLSLGELQVSDSHKLTITGPGAGVLTLSGNDANRIVSTNGGSDVAITGLRMTAGKSIVGGAVHNGGEMSLANVTFTLNNAVGTDGGDGNDVTLAEPGGLAIGGAIYSDGTLNISDCTFVENHATGGKGGDAEAGAGTGGLGAGGAIYSDGDITVADTVFEANTATGGDAGQHSGSGSPVAAGEARGGAVVLATVDFADLHGCTFIENVSTGGDGANGGFLSGGNGAEARGGAIYAAAVNFDLHNDSFTNNQAVGGAGGGGADGGAGGDANGGAIYTTSVAGFSSLIFDTNSASGGAAGGGDTALNGGTARGGAIYGTLVVNLDDSTFSSNSATGGDGADAPSTLSDGGAGWGGAIYGTGVLDIATSTFSTNVAQGGGSPNASPGQAVGGAIYGEDIVNFVTSTATGNVAQVPAAGPGRAGTEAFVGAIFANVDELFIASSTIDHNLAHGGDAGSAVGADANGKSGGDAYGGGVYAKFLTLYNSTVAFNNAEGGDASDANGEGDAGPGGEGHGGGIYIALGGSGGILHATIDSNHSLAGAAGDGEPIPVIGSSGGNIESVPQAQLTNTIVTRGLAQFAPDLAGTFNCDHLLVSNDDSATLTGNDIIIAQDPQLGPLEDNGGLTETMLISATGPAHDAGNSASAGILEFDQRGDGFPRLRGEEVDLGAVEVGAPIIEVSGNGKAIAEDDSTPSSLDSTAFGTAKFGTPIDRTFTIKNTGSADLLLSSVVPPVSAGFTTISVPLAKLAPGQSTTFIVRFNPASPGTYSGDVVIGHNETSGAQFRFRVEATALASTIKVNFQPGDVEVPTSYLLDAGQAFGSRGNGYSYGFNQNIASATRDRDMLSDQLKDTLVHIQQYGVRTWEIAVPNGSYLVHLVAGDAKYFDSVYKINVEGVLTVNGTPTSGNRFVEGTQTVVVTDGKLTISNASGGVNNKLDYVEITPVTPSTKIDFTTAGAALPAGYLRDSGSIFGSRGNGFSYGWNQSASSFTRDRNSGLSPDQRYDTLVHTQLYGNRTWEIAVPNGHYQVKVVAGDPSYFDSVYKINVEGVLTVNGTPTSGNRWISGTQLVQVSDGRLTVTNAAGAVNNKLAFIEFQPVID